MSSVENMVKFEIDGKEVVGKRDETILQIARRNGIYIPTMCYLTKVKPIASCRMCVVEVEGMEDPILSCQERAVDGLKITTNSPELYNQRQNIMKLYDVNHPLQCGVCDKSGECDLQNKTLEFNVSTQNFSAVEQARKLENWGNIVYDPYLCIMCERCVRVSNEIVGDEALQISVGGYNSRIINTKKDDPNVDWAECSAVCPVGALSDRDFKYSANAWELKRVPAACAHSPLAGLIYYESRMGKILRVRHEFEFDSMGGVCRYGYDFENRGSNNQNDMQKTVQAFNKADTIRFNSIITNEEALILQKLKELKGYKLINDEAYNYQQFIKAFASTSGKSLYEGTSENIKNSDFIVVFGSRVADDISGLKFKINQASKRQKAEVVYMHPIEDSSINNIVTQFVKYEVGSEEALLALLISSLLDKSKLPDELKNLDNGYISAESNVGEEEITSIVANMNRKRSFSFVVGSDLYAHPKAQNIAKMLGVLERESNFEVTIIPPSVNTLGVSLICDLDSEAGKYTIGYNNTGDFILSSIEGAGDVNLPAINQQEGTFTNLDKKVVPTHVALPFDGFCLNDISNELGLDNRYTIDYTKELPTKAGFVSKEFDELDTHFDESRVDARGYELKVKKRKPSADIDEIGELDSFDGIVIYSCNPNSQKNIFTNLSKNLKTTPYLRGSKQFSQAAKIKDGDKVSLKFGEEEIIREYKEVVALKGSIALMPNFDLGFDGQSLNGQYRFHKVNIKQVSK